MNRVISTDGTAIAHTERGEGPAVILVGGGLDDGSENAPLATALAGHGFTVHNYARRGRGDSGDAAEYSVMREIEDLDALIVRAGGTAHLFGVSSGGALVLEAAASGLSVDRVAVYEVPYGLSDEFVAGFGEYRRDLDRLLAEDRRDDAMALFMRLAGSSEEDVAAAREAPVWPGLRALAPTLAYDAACLGDGLPPRTRLARIDRPTLVLTGGTVDPHTGGLASGFFDEAADAVAASVPGAIRRVVPGQAHVADPDVLGAELARFFAA